MVMAMAFSRDAWETRFRQRFEGSLKGYTKIHLVEKLGLFNCWEKEVDRLVKKLLELFDPKVTKRKGKWDVYKAAAEAFLEASGEQWKCKEALNDFRGYDEYSDADVKKVYKYWSERVPDSADLSMEILERYFPAVHRDGVLAALQKL